MTQAEMGAAVPCVRWCGRCCTIAYPKIDAGLAIASIIEEELVGEITRLWNINVPCALSSISQERRIWSSPADQWFARKKLLRCIGPLGARLI